MLKRKVVLGLGACILVMLLVGLSFSAGAGGRGRGVRGRQPGRGTDRPAVQNRDPQQMRARMQQMMEQRMKEQLGVTSDEEWKTIQPRLQKVQDLSRQVNAGGQMGTFWWRDRFGAAGRGPGGRRGQSRSPAAESEAPDRELSAVEKAAAELRDILGSESPQTDDIKAKLTAYRTAREEVRKNLAKAQDDLKQVVTVKQEATLVLMGLLN